VRSRFVLSMRVDPVSSAEAADLVMTWANEKAARVVCAANVHMVMEAWDDRRFRASLSAADLAVADGRPIWLACRLLGTPDACHLRGQDLMLGLCEASSDRGVPVGLFGSTEQILDKLCGALTSRFPALKIAYVASPPFRPLDPDEDEEVLAVLEASGARILFVALGCPKQEQWMLEHRATTSCVMVGVGAAFEMLAGERRAAPSWMQRAGLEWAFRVAAEPRRLWRRYARHNLRFVFLLAYQVLRRPRWDQGR
jgi:N-acetylglucosaminyldiphosphoundecaprenol N-acetyl-beta-D-mannosaminyltransferase